ALAGALGRAGWGEGEVAAFVGAVAVAAGDEESDDRVDVARRSVAKAAEQKKVTGWTTLGKAIGKEVVNRAREWPICSRGGGGEGRPARVKESDWLVQSAEAADLELFHDARRTAYAALNVQGHREVLAVDSKGFRRWLAQRADEAD